MREKKKRWNQTQTTWKVALHLNSYEVICFKPVVLFGDVELERHDTIFNEIDLHLYMQVKERTVKMYVSMVDKGGLNCCSSCLNTLFNSSDIELVPHKLGEGAFFS